MGTGPPGARGWEPGPARGAAPHSPARPGPARSRRCPRTAARPEPGPRRAPAPRRRSHGGGGVRPPPPAAPPAALPPPPSRSCPHTHFDAICAARAATGCRGRRRRLLILRRLLRRLLLRCRLLLLLLRRGLGRLSGRLLGSARRGRLRPVALRHLVPGRGPATAGLKRAPTASAWPRRAATTLARAPPAAGGGRARRGCVRCRGDAGTARPPWPPSLRHCSAPWQTQCWGWEIPHWDGWERPLRASSPPFNVELLSTQLSQVPKGHVSVFLNLSCNGDATSSLCSLCQ